MAAASAAVLSAASAHGRPVPDTSGRDVYLPPIPPLVTSSDPPFAAETAKKLGMLKVTTVRHVDNAMAEMHPALGWAWELDLSRGFGARASCCCARPCYLALATGGGARAMGGASCMPDPTGYITALVVGRAQAVANYAAGLWQALFATRQPCCVVAAVMVVLAARNARAQAVEAMIATLRGLLNDVETSDKLAAAPAAAAAARQALVPTMHAPMRETRAHTKLDMAGFRALYALRCVAGGRMLASRSWACTRRGVCRPWNAQQEADNFMAREGSRAAEFRAADKEAQARCVKLAITQRISNCIVTLALVTASLLMLGQGTLRAGEGCGRTSCEDGKECGRKCTSSLRVLLLRR